MKEKKYITPKEVEDIYGLNRGTLANWRCQGKGPAYVKSGRRILYKKSMIDHYLYSKRVLTNDFDEEEFMCHYETTITDPETPF